MPSRSAVIQALAGHPRWIAHWQYLQRAAVVDGRADPSFQLPPLSTLISDAVTRAPRSRGEGTDVRRGNSARLTKAAVSPPVVLRYHGPVHVPTSPVRDHTAGRQHVTRERGGHVTTIE